MVDMEQGNVAMLVLDYADLVSHVPEMHWQNASTLTVSDVRDILNTQLQTAN